MGYTLTYLIGVGSEGGVEYSPHLTLPRLTFTQKGQLVGRAMDSAPGRRIPEYAIKIIVITNLRGTCLAACYTISGIMYTL